MKNSPSLLIAALSFLPLTAWADPLPSREWLQRPWEIRYIMFVDSERLIWHSIGLAKKLNAKKDPPGRPRVYLDSEALFEPIRTLHVPGESSVAIILAEFDRTGRLHARKAGQAGLVAKRNVMNDLVLAREDRMQDRPYYLAKWASGIPGDIDFSPGVCIIDDKLRYSSDFVAGDYSDNFGCREWTAQLYARERPYIDVTSYGPTLSHIGSFVGWSRFSDPHKPVIGLHFKTWLCLHECPSGERPGVIPDIKTWTRKHGFPMPERPPKQPTYPDADYADDLNEHYGD